MFSFQYQRGRERRVCTPPRMRVPGRSQWLCTQCPGAAPQSGAGRCGLFIHGPLQHHEKGVVFTHTNTPHGSVRACGSRSVALWARTPGGQCQMAAQRAGISWRRVPVRPFWEPTALIWGWRAGWGRPRHEHTTRCTLNQCSQCMSRLHSKGEGCEVRLVFMKV